MNGRRHTVVVVASLLLVGLLAPAGTVATTQVEPEFDAFVPQPTLAPGEPNELTVQIVNDADDEDDTARTAGSVEATLSADGTHLSVQSGTTLLGSMADGQPAQVTFALDVPYDVPAGTYQLTLTVRYSDDGERKTERLPVEVRVEERPIFEVVETTSSVAVGESGTVSVTVENVGSEAVRDATVTLRTTSGQVAVGDGEQASRFAGALEPGESTTLEYDVSVAPDAPRQSYAMQVTVDYTRASGRQGTSRVLSTGVVPEPEQEFALQDVTGQLMVGEERTIDGTLVNTGDRRAEDVVLVIESTSQSVTPTESEVPLGDLAPGENTPFTFNVDVSEGAEPGPKRFSMRVEFRTVDGDEREKELRDVRSEVRPAPDWFTVSSDDASVTAGSDSRLRLEVTNNRDEEVRDVTAKLFTASPLSTDDDEAYAGTLEPGESTVVVFSVAADSSALAKNYPVDVDFQFRTPGGDTRLSDTYTVPVTVDRNDGGSFPGTYLVIGGGVIVLALVGAAIVIVGRR